MYYFIGIKGSGMSALAVILKQLGYDVSGSDIEKHLFTEAGLIENNIPFYGYDANNIKNGMIIIKGASIKEDNVELVRAYELGLEILEYNEMVGKLTDMFKTVCVCGCHGKTTTTTMLAVGLGNELKMNYLIGDGTGYAKQDNKFFKGFDKSLFYRHIL
jgi:UDP-N-acetylmuramate--alanine ligase